MNSATRTISERFLNERCATPQVIESSRKAPGVSSTITTDMAQGQPKKPASQLAKSPKKGQTKLGKGGMPLSEGNDR